MPAEQFVDYLVSQGVSKTITAVLIGKTLASFLTAIIRDVIHPLLDPYDKWTVTIFGKTLNLDDSFDTFLRLILAILIGYFLYLIFDKMGITG